MGGTFPQPCRSRIGEFADELRKGCTVSANRRIRQATSGGETRCMTSTSHAIGWRRYARPGVLVLVTGISLYVLLPSLVAVFASSRSLSGWRRRVFRLQSPLSVAAQTAGFPHGVSALSDSRSVPGGAESSRTHQ
jgi:hypothetical protein